MGHDVTAYKEGKVGLAIKADRLFVGDKSKFFQKSRYF